MLRLSALALLAAMASPAMAHSPAAHGEAATLLRWNFEPWVVALLAASAALYAAGVSRLWRRAGRGRGVTVAQAARFALGWVTLAVALVSPVDTLGGSLFSAHMVQHELLMVVAAPLFVTSRPLEAWTWALAPNWRRIAGDLVHRPVWLRAWGAFTDPMGAWIVHALALWVWHVPAFFEAALVHEGLHALQHATFFGSALLFWWTVLGIGARRAGGGGAVASLFTTMLHTGALGALLTFTPRAWYAHYADTAAFGLTALEDQQLGGLIMWVPGGLAYLVAGLALVATWLSPPRGRALR